MKPEDGSEKVYFVLGEQCIRIYEWNEHYIKDQKVNDLIIFDVTDQKYNTWENFLDLVLDDLENNTELPITPDFLDHSARKYLKRLRYKVYLPLTSIPKKKILKTKKKIENGYISTHK